MPKEFLILNTDRPFSQDAWVEEKDSKGRVTKPARPARDEVEVQVRLDRQYRAALRLPAAETAGAKRQGAIASACAKLALGEFITPNIQVIEVEQHFTVARPAMVTPEQKDEQGNIVGPESFLPAQAERMEYAVTLRIDGMHLQKVSLDESEIKPATWKATLAGKVKGAEIFRV